MDIKEIVEDKMRFPYVDGHVEAEENKVKKRKEKFQGQILKGVQDMEVTLTLK